MYKLLDDVPAINWSDFLAAGRQTREILHRVAADREYLRYLVEHVAETPALFEKCERHELDDKIVIYDAMADRNFRIRFRLATAYQDERPHQHRFCFSTVILRGNYFQTLYTTDQSLDDGVDFDQIRPTICREEPMGSAFTIDHNVIHSTIAPPDTISLVLRGPAAKQRAIIIIATPEKFPGVTERPTRVPNVARKSE